MSSRFKTDQEFFWEGHFGDDYTQRNSNAVAQAQALRMRTKELQSIPIQLKSAVELGANSGLNMRCLSALFPLAELTGVEINSKAASLLSETGCHVVNTSIHQWTPDCQYELVILVGVLIHLNPLLLPEVYRLIAQTSSRYVLFSEYFNPSPVEVDYRGHSGRLFKRDFAGEFLRNYPEFRLIDSGFHYFLGPSGGDNQSYFLMEK